VRPSAKTKTLWPKRSPTWHFKAQFIIFSSAFPTQELFNLAWDGGLRLPKALPLVRFWFVCLFGLFVGCQPGMDLRVGCVAYRLGRQISVWGRKITVIRLHVVVFLFLHSTAVAIYIFYSLRNAVYAEVLYGLPFVMTNDL
jgi:hypothetical protein